MKYTHLWASQDGETHIAEGELQNFVNKSYSGSLQAVLQGPATINNIVFTVLDTDFDNPWHCCPEVQFVITIKGNWYIKTSDGSERTFGPGDILFQDNVEQSPANRAPEHYSGTIGDEPCQQVIVQVARAPEVDNPLPM